MTYNENIENCYYLIRKEIVCMGNVAKELSESRFHLPLKLTDLAIVLYFQHSIAEL